MSLSVIIPTLNEADTITATIRAVRGQQPHEIIVVDGGSTDDTVACTAEADRVVASPRGRSAQMNAGAAAARGDQLLFLHADCNPGEGALSAAVECLRRPAVVAGCFRMRVDASDRVYRVIDFCATARVRLTGLIYGDQGLFVRRDVFEQVGGFPPVRLLEDVLLSMALRRRGRIGVADAAIAVSPRRWQRQGVVRQTLRNWALTALAAAGVHPDRLAAFYPAVR
jgi:rSAM/selenodomain-associated transferase 2